MLEMDLEVPESTGYQPNWLIVMLHSMPHLDFSLELVNSTFNFENSKYKESLIFWASVPVLMLLLMLMSLLAYLVFRCICKLRYDEEAADEGGEVQEPSLQGVQNCLACLRWTSTSLAIIACGTSAVGFYGNRLTHKGVNELADSINYVIYSSYMARNQMILLKSSMARVSKGIMGVREVIEKHMAADNAHYYSYNYANVSHFNYHLTELNKALQQNKDIMRNLGLVVNLESTNALTAKHDMHHALGTTKNYEFYRWLVVVIVFSWLIFLFLILLVGIARNSKCLLLLFCSFGIFSLVASCLSASIHLAFAIGVSDFCSLPETSVTDLLTQYIDIRLATYYVKCDPLYISNPYKEHFANAQTNVFEVQTIVYFTIQSVRHLIPQGEFAKAIKSLEQGISEVSSCIVKLLAVIDCNNLHNDYQTGIKGVCLATLPGIAMSVLLCTMLALLLTTLVFLVIKLWRVFRPLQDSIIKAPQGLSDSFQERSLQRGESSASLCRQYTGLINPSDSCGAIRESIA